jgi:hypothetical protein
LSRVLPPQMGQRGGRLIAVIGALQLLLKRLHRCTKVSSSRLTRGGKFVLTFGEVDRAERSAVVRRQRGAGTISAVTSDYILTQNCDDAGWNSGLHTRGGNEARLRAAHMSASRALSY